MYYVLVCLFFIYSHVHTLITFRSRLSGKISKQKEKIELKLMINCTKLKWRIMNWKLHLRTWREATLELIRWTSQAGRG